MEIEESTGGLRLRRKTVNREVKAEKSWDAEMKGKNAGGIN
jgi:hypothetical protein